MIYRHCINVVILILSLFTAKAGATGLPLSYCDGVANTDEKGIATNSAEVSAAIGFQGAHIEKLEGHHLTSLRCYLGEAEKLQYLTLWVRVNSLDSEDVCSVTTEEPMVGWNELELPEPLELTSCDNLYIGMTFKQQGIVRALVASPDRYLPMSHYRYSGGMWLDQSDSRPALALEGIVGDYEAKKCDIVVSDIKVDKHFYRFNENVEMDFLLRNYGTEELGSVDISCTAGGATLFEGKVEEWMPMGSYRYFHCSFPAPEQVMADASLEVKGKVILEGETYSSEREGDSWFNVMDKIYQRRMLVEEGTGTWCAYCPRGIVGLARMFEKYPGTFIPVAIHYNDEMSLDDYAMYMQFPNYPSCNIDRMYWGLDPNFDDLEDMYDEQDALGAFAEVALEGSVDTEEGIVSGKVTAKFDFNNANADYRLAYILTEDDVIGPQLNAFYGGGYGEMGGFEDLGMNVPEYSHQHVARGVYPSFDGGRAFLSGIEKDKEMKEEFEFTLPSNVDTSNLSLAVALIDGHTGMVINSSLIKLEEKESSVAMLKQNGWRLDGDRLIFGETVGHLQVFDVFGQLISEGSNISEIYLPCNGLFLIVGDGITLKILRK